MGLVDGKVCVVTGGGSGIGRAACEEFAAQGADAVVVVDTDGDAAEATVEQIGSTGTDTWAAIVDVTDEDAVAGLLDEVVARHGRIDGAFNNAGINDESRAFVDLDRTAWDRMIEVNLTSVFLCMKHELRHMGAQGSGAIVNTSSGAGLTPAPGLPHYTAAKHGVLGLTKAASAEYNSRGVRVNAVLPGMTRTPMIERWFEMNPDLANLVLSALPGRALGEPIHVANAAVWLCSDHAAWVSGVSLVVDGGGMNR